MSLFIKLFNTTAEYNAYTADTENFIKPNVSCAMDDLTTVHYNPIDPYNGHDYVDLGLPSGTKWAKYNVGATSESDYGSFYQYGKGADQYAVTSGQSYYSGTEDPLAFSVDTARQVWGGSWHMPTKTQLEELTANTTYTWATINGVNGGKFTASNGNYIFIPAAGEWYDGSHYNEGLLCNVWSSSPSDSEFALLLGIASEGKGIVETERYNAFSVRPVVG